MAIMEALPPDLEAGYGSYDHLNYGEAANLMQLLVPHGLTELTNDDLNILGQLTDRLKATGGERALSEYDRYNAIKDRRLVLPYAELYEQLNDKTILVTGGTGLIGSALMDTISQFGPRRLVSVSRFETPTMKNVEGVEYLQADIRDNNAIHQIVESVKPDIIYHVAADKYNAEAEKRARHTLTTNILGVENIIEAAEAAGTGLVVYASTGKATRPYSPDIYASSKKTGELLMARAAAAGKFICAAGRFTHVVDDSNVRRKVNERIDAGLPVLLQSPEVLMYTQSAYESAQLLLISGLEAKPGEFKVQAIRNLDLPINLAHIGLGAIVKREANVPIYFTGVTEGYEDRAWPHLYGMESGDLSPLVNSIEAHDAQPAQSCPDIDSFVLNIAEHPEVDHTLAKLKDTFNDQDPSVSLRDRNQDLAWAMLDARIKELPTKVIEKICKRIERAQAQGEQLSNEFVKTNQSFLRALEARREAEQLQAAL